MPLTLATNLAKTTQAGTFCTSALQSNYPLWRQWVRGIDRDRAIWVMGTSRLNDQSGQGPDRVGWPVRIWQRIRLLLGVRLGEVYRLGNGEPLLVK